MPSQTRPIFNQSSPIATEFGEKTQDNGHYAVQGHLSQCTRLTDGQTVVDSKTVRMLRSRTVKMKLVNDGLQRGFGDLQMTYQASVYNHSRLEGLSVTYYNYCAIN